MNHVRHLPDRGHQERGAADRGEHRAARPRRPLSRADLLDVRGRAPADRRSAARRLRHAGGFFPFVGHDRLPDRPPAGVPRRRAPARAGDDRRRGAPRQPGLLALPALRLRGPVGLSALPSCMRKLKERCYSCSKPIDPAWRICPFCEAETSAPTPSSTRRRRRQTTDQSTVAAEVAQPEPRPRRPGPARRRVAGDADTLRAMAIERTLILVKPDAFARGLTGEIIARFERKGLKIVAAKHMTVTEDLAKQHYAEHTERPFFGELVELHHLRPDRRARARGRGRDPRRPPGDRRHQPARGDHRLDPRRLRDRGRPEHGPRLGLARVRPARGGACSSPKL